MNKQDKHYSRRGFTVIELLVVVSIIGMLSSVVFATIQTAREKAVVGAGMQFSGYVYRTKGDTASVMLSFNDFLSDTAKDISPNRNDLTVAGVTYPWSTDTPVGTGYSFTLEFSPSPIFGSFTSPILLPQNTTISFWIKTTYSPSSARYIFSNRSSSLLGGIGVALAPLGKIYFVSNGSITSIGAVNNGKWRNVTVTSDGTTAKIYIDGKLDRSGGIARAGYVAIPAYINSDVYAPTGLSGLLDDFRIYESTLSLDDVEKIYAEGLTKHTIAQK